MAPEQGEWCAEPSPPLIQSSTLGNLSCELLSSFALIILDLLRCSFSQAVRTERDILASESWLEFFAWNPPTPGLLHLFNFLDILQLIFPQHRQQRGSSFFPSVKISNPMEGHWVAYIGSHPYVSLWMRQEALQILLEWWAWKIQWKELFKEPSNSIFPKEKHDLLKPGGFLHHLNSPSVQSMTFMYMYKSYTCTGQIQVMHMHGSFIYINHIYTHRSYYRHRSCTYTGNINIHVMNMHGSYVCTIMFIHKSHICKGHVHALIMLTFPTSTSSIKWVEWSLRTL